MIADRQLYLTNSGAVVFGAYDGVSRRTINSAAGLNDGTWHHVAATLSGSTMRLYVDGELVDSAGNVIQGACGCDKTSTGLEPRSALAAPHS